MPEVTIHIGGRSFEVACQDGEEHFLHSAAKMLDDEAQALAAQNWTPARNAHAVDGWIIVGR